MNMTASLTDLRRELDEWAASGKTARFLWRDDDAIADTPRLRRVIEIARTAGYGGRLAVVPEKADDALARLTASAPLRVWQHGWAHSDYGDGEFGHGRPLEAMIDDALRGWQRMGPDLRTPRMGGGLRPAVPPCCRCRSRRCCRASAISASPPAIR